MYIVIYWTHNGECHQTEKMTHESAKLYADSMDEHQGARLMFVWR